MFSRIEQIEQYTTDESQIYPCQEKRRRENKERSQAKEACGIELESKVSVWTQDLSQVKDYWQIDGNR